MNSRAGDKRFLLAQGPNADMAKQPPKSGKRSDSSSHRKKVQEPMEPERPQTKRTSGFALCSKIAEFTGKTAEEVQNILQPPAALFMQKIESESGTIFLWSAEENFGVNIVFDAIRRPHDNLKNPNTSFGVIVYETASTGYILLVDMREDMQRRMFIHQALYRYGEGSYWDDVKKVVDDAVNQFSQTDKDHVLLCTGPNPRLVELVQVH